VERRALRRDEVKVSVAGRPVGVKRGFLGPDLVTVQPEYDDARRVSQETGRPLAEVLSAARLAALDGTGEV
jgi:uncharacterized protein (DUF111 family)